MTATLKNTGDATLTVKSIATSGDFHQTNNCPIGPATLAPGASCTISVTYTPSTTGDIVGLLSVTDDAAGSPHTVDLDGWGD